MFTPLFIWLIAALLMILPTIFFAFLASQRFACVLVVQIPFKLKLLLLFLFLFRILLFSSTKASVDILPVWIHSGLFDVIFLYCIAFFLKFRVWAFEVVVFLTKTTSKLVFRLFTTKVAIVDSRSVNFLRRNR